MSSPGNNHSHARWRSLLERHIDGDLAPPERMELFAHLEECDECQATLEAEEAMIDRLSRIPKLTAPSDLRAAILREAARERAEALQPLSEDARYTQLLRIADADEDMEAGANTPVPATRRKRRSATAWRRASPYLAMAFLAGSAGFSILSRQLPAGAGGSMSGIAGNLNYGGYMEQLASVFSPRRQAPIEEMYNPLMPVKPGRDVVDRSPIAHADHSAGSGPKVIVQQPGSGRNGADFGSRLSDVTGVPVAAEQERPVTQTFVLKLVKADSSTGSGTRLADALQRTLEDDLGGQIKQYEHSERGDRRSRTFTVDLSPSACGYLLEAFQPYRVEVVPEPTDPLWRSSIGAEPVAFSGTSDEFMQRLRSHVSEHKHVVGENGARRIRLVVLQDVME